MLRLDYETQHWGTPPNDVVDMVWPSSMPASSMGEVRSIAYATDKGGDAAVFEHVFEFHDGWRTNLLRVGRGKLRTPRVGKRLVALGRVIDIKLASGRVLHPTLLWVATIPETRRNGGPVILASRHTVPIALEHRVIDRELFPYVTPHGIEG